MMSRASVGAEIPGVGETLFPVYSMCRCGESQGVETVLGPEVRRWGLQTKKDGNMTNLREV